MLDLTQVERGGPYPAARTADEWDQLVLWFIEHRGNHVTWAELMALPGAEGPLAVGIAEKNVWFWQGVSADLLDCMDRLRLEKGLINVEESSWLAYLADGRTLTLPLVKTPPRAGYKHPHWLPVCFTSNCSEDAAKRPCRRSSVTPGPMA